MHTTKMLISIFMKLKNSNGLADPVNSVNWVCQLRNIWYMPCVVYAYNARLKYIFCIFAFVWNPQTASYLNIFDASAWIFNFNWNTRGGKLTWILSVEVWGGPAIQNLSEVKTRLLLCRKMWCNSKIFSVGSKNRNSQSTLNAFVFPFFLNECFMAKEPKSTCMCFIVALFISTRLTYRPPTDNFSTFETHNSYLISLNQGLTTDLI